MTKIIKVIALLLSILIPSQVTVWPLPESYKINMLQPELLFSSFAQEDDFFQIVSGYLSYYLAYSEKNSEFKNVVRLKKSIDKQLAFLRGLDIIPRVFREKLPVCAEYDSGTASIVIDLGTDKIRYFDHNVYGNNFPLKKGYRVKEEKVGKYLTRQVISLKTSSNINKRIFVKPSGAGKFISQSDKRGFNERKNSGKDDTKSPYNSDKAKLLLKKWKSIPGISKNMLIDIYYNENSLSVPAEATKDTPQGAIYSQSDIRDLIAIGQKFLSGKNIKILDAGSGAGKAIAVFSGYAGHVTGIEIDSTDRSGGQEKRLFEIGKERIEFLGAQGIVDRERIELTDDDFFDPDLDLSEYDAVYHYWAFNKNDTERYVEKITKKLLDNRKGLKPGALFIVNSLVKEVDFPGLEKVDVSVGKNITVYRRPPERKKNNITASKAHNVSCFLEDLNGLRLYGREDREITIIYNKFKNSIKFVNKKGEEAGKIKLSFPNGPNGKWVRIDEVTICPGFENMMIEQGFTRIMREKIPEKYLLGRIITEEESIKYFERLCDKEGGMNEQNIVKGYDPFLSGIGRMYMESGFTMQVVQLVRGSRRRKYEIIAFRSDEPYDYKKAKNMLIKFQFSKWGEVKPHLSLGNDGDLYSIRISLMADPSERQLVTTIYKNITAELPEACSILSVGVGTGAIAGLFAENGYSVTGVDITPEVLTIAAQKGIRTIEADAGENAFWEMDEHSTKYGAVIFSESLEYFDEPEKVFKMARKVLCEKGKIYVLARNIPGNRREEKYEKALKEAGFRIKSGAARMLFGNNAGMRMLSGEMLPARRADKKEIIKRIEKIIPRLIHDMMSLETANSTDVNIAGRADYVPGKKEDKKIVILIDKDLSGMNNNTDIIRSVKNLINTLAGIKGNNSELAVFLENLEIIPVEGGSIERGGRFRQYKNIIAVTRTSNKSFFENINTEIIVAAIEDKDFPEKAYLPLIEVTLFAIGKFLKLEQALLEQYYQNIPDVKSLKELKESGEFSDIFDPDVKTFVIQLPHARSFNTSKSLVETMEIIRGLLRKA